LVIHCEKGRIAVDATQGDKGQSDPAIERHVSTLRVVFVKSCAADALRQPNRLGIRLETSAVRLDHDKV
jgi:hypothetical protein